ncbi:hypothetical protein RRG08_035021 [Elysia crispata]|uniref:Uncharacterized protein n=1 Tax=Elysia crispata TaxID=231223 RepID=A0AAE0ZT75_9GAST|nr:hypothetical protein RRG08_035021 [Elysia crispata]
MLTDAKDIQFRDSPLPCVRGVHAVNLFKVVASLTSKGQETEASRQGCGIVTAAWGSIGRHTLPEVMGFG